MADVKALVNELAELDPAGPPIVTLYLDTRWRDEQQRERVRLFFSERAREARALFEDGGEIADSVRRTLDVLEDFVERLVNQDVHEAAGGVMLVASVDRGLLEELAIPEPFEPAMYIDQGARLAPLVETLSRLRPALFAVIDSTGAEILQWEMGGIVDERIIERDVPNRHKMGGWSQRRYQQHVKGIIHGVWKECADLLSRLARENPRADLVLFGQEQNLRGFQKLLPQEINERVVGTLPVPPGNDRNRIMETAREALRDHHMSERFDTVHLLLRQGLSDRSGVLGVEDTLLASNERRLRLLAVSPRFAARGFHCAQCDAVWLTGATGCTFCGGPTRTVGLHEELMRRSVRENVDVVVVPSGGPLDAYRGVGGLLRRLSSEEWQRLGQVGPRRGTFTEAPVSPG